MVMTLYFWSKFIKFCSVDVLYLCINIRYYHGRSCHISLYMNSSTSLHLWADKYLWIMLILLRIFTMQCPLPILYYEYCLFIFVFGIYVLFFLTCMYLNNALLLLLLLLFVTSSYIHPPFICNLQLHPPTLYSVCLSVRHKRKFHRGWK